MDSPIIFFLTEKTFTEQIPANAPEHFKTYDNYEKYTLILKSDGTTSLERIFHYYRTRNSENYDDEDTEESTYFGTYEIVEHNEELRRIKLKFNKRNITTSAWQDSNKITLIDEEVNREIEFIERFDLKTVGFSYYNSILSNFRDTPLDIKYDWQYRTLQNIGLSEKEIKLVFIKYIENFENYFIENFDYLDLEEKANYLCKKKGEDFNHLQTKLEKYVSNIIKANGDKWEAYSHADNIYADYRSILKSEGITDEENLFNEYCDIPIYTVVSSDYVRYFKRKEIYFAENEKMKNYYLLTNEDINYRTIFQCNGVIPSAVYQISNDMKLAVKEDLERLEKDGFINAEINFDQAWINFQSGNEYEDLVAMVKREQDPQIKKDFEIICDKFYKTFTAGLLELYLQKDKNVWLTIIYSNDKLIEIYNTYCNLVTPQVLAYGIKTCCWDVEYFDINLLLTKNYFKENGIELDFKDIINLWAETDNTDKGTLLSLFTKRIELYEKTDIIINEYTNSYDKFVIMRALCYSKLDIPVALLSLYLPIEECFKKEIAYFLNKGYDKGKIIAALTEEYRWAPTRELYNIEAFIKIISDPKKLEFYQTVNNYTYEYNHHAALELFEKLNWDSDTLFLQRDYPLVWERFQDKTDKKALLEAARSSYGDCDKIEELLK